MSRVVRDARRQVQDGIRAARKTYHNEWLQADALRKQKNQAVIALQAQQRAVRIRRRTEEHQRWRTQFEASELVRKQLKAQKALQVSKVVAAKREVQRAAQVTSVISPLKASLDKLIDSTNLSRKISPQLPLHRVKLRGLPDVDIVHQDELLLKYLCDPQDPHLSNFQREYCTSDSNIFTQFSAEFMKGNMASV
uniref:Uncharacterized protein n=1 Tax=Spongospora subterranea TaxID=70186 RepID=A0A0H5R8N9_9EUKA|eukprot:CRZ10082.1 hypothetical protein [Spongospora subterranea]